MASGAHDDALPRLQTTNSIEEPITNGIFGKAKRNKVVEDGRTSSSQSTINLVNCILGAGVLGYPFCFRSCGLLLGTLIMLVSITASRFSYNLLLYCSQISNKRTYEDLAEQAVGKLGRQIVQLCTAALNLGCIVAYLNILADVLSAVAGTIIPPGAEPSRNAFITGVSLFGALPVALWVRDHATIVTFMMASVGFVVLFAVVVVIFALAPHPVTAAAVSSVTLWQPEGLLVAFPVIVYSFTAHPYYLGIFNNLHAPTFQRMSRVTNVAMGLSGALYWIVGVFGYLTFRNRTAGDLLRNFGAANVDGLRGAYERAIKLCYGLSILGSVPLVILPFYNLMLPLLGFRGRGDGLGLGPGFKRINSGLPPDANDTPVSPNSLDPRGSGSYSTCTSPLPLVVGGVAGGNATSTSLGCGAAAALGGASGGRSRPSASSRGGGGGGGAGGLGRSSSAQVDVVDLKLHADRDLRDGGVEGEELGFAQHALVVLVVLGSALATAIWVPNIEFIFGLTGATASVLLSYILPAITFIRLMDLNPELLGGGNFKVIPEAIRSQWLWRKRKAVLLLCFGVVSGITCTDAILGAVQQEAAVVALAQQLVAHEVVVAETAKVQQKARAAVTAMSAVELAAKELGAAQAGVNASGTFTKLQHAAEQLDNIAGAGAGAGAGGTGGGGGKGGGKGGKKEKDKEWGLGSLVKEHQQHAAETRVFKAVEAVLSDVKEELRRTAAGVAGVVTQLDATIEQLKSGAGSGAGAGGGSGGGTAGGGGGAAADAVAAAKNGYGTGPGAGSGAGSGSSGPGSGSGSTSGSGAGAAGSGSGSGTTMRDRAGDLAQELGKALGAFSDVAGNASVAGKSLTQVRSTAVSTLLALNQTIAVLDHVTAAVEAAKKSHKHDDEIKKAAAVAMRLALNATATSALAMQLTGEALQRSATEEASELLGMLVQVSHDLEKTAARAKVVKTKRVDANTTAAAAAASSSAVTAAAGADTASALGAASTGAGFAAEEGGGSTAADGSAAAGTATSDGSSLSASSSAKTGTGTSVSCGAASAGGSGGKAGKSDGGKTGRGSGGGGTGLTAGEGALVDLPVNGSVVTGGGAGSGAASSPAAIETDRAAEAAGQLEQVIKDLNIKIAAANTANAAATTANANTAGAAAAATAAAAAAASAAAATGTSDAGALPGLDAPKSATAEAGGAVGVGKKGGSSAADAAAANDGALVDLDGAADDGAEGAAVAATAADTAANTTAAAAASGLGGGGLNVSGIAAALQDAVAVTRVKQEEALQEIQDSLTSTDAKVAERVVGILKDLSETNQMGEAAAAVAAAATSASSSSSASAAAAASNKAAADGAVVEPVPTVAGGEAAAVAAAVAAGVGAEATSATGGVQGALLGLVHAITEVGGGGGGGEDGDDDPRKVEGPVVKVDAEGHLIQEDDSDTVAGPTVKDADTSQAASASASGSSSSDSSRKSKKVEAEAGSSSGGGSGAGGGAKLRKLGLGLGIGVGRAAG